MPIQWQPFLDSLALHCAFRLVGEMPEQQGWFEAAQIEPEARYKIYEGNARRVYPRLDAALKAKGR